MAYLTTPATNVADGDAQNTLMYYRVAIECQYGSANLGESYLTS